MPNFIYAYHGGKKPETETDVAEFMHRWKAWVEGLGAASVNSGNPVGMSKTLSANGVTDDGGANPLSGYSIVEADSIESAVDMAKGCPHLDHGTIEIAEIIAMPE